MESLKKKIIFFDYKDLRNTENKNGLQIDQIFVRSTTNALMLVQDI